MYFHWSNENEKPGGRHGWAVKHGRAWWRIAGHAAINWEWHLFGTSCGAWVKFEQSDDRGIQLHLAIPLLFSFYVSFVGGPAWWIARKLLPGPGSTCKYEDREISLRVHNWAIWWTVWLDDMGCMHRRGRAPRWRDGSFQVLDVFLGRYDVSWRQLHQEQVRIPMPEGSYQALCTLEEGTWKRPRWFPRRRLLAKVEFPQDRPLPIPGKGENAWDCGEDAIYSSSFPATTVSEAIGHVVSSALARRRKYGGRDWTPEEKRA